MADDVSGRRVFQPSVLQAKQELLASLKAGELRVSKYNCLTENQKMFVELVVFGGYTAEQAIRVIDPTIHQAKLTASRMMADPTMIEVLEELTVAKDTKFRTEAMSARDTALSKLMYIMNTSRDETTQLVAAKTILEKTNDYMKANKKEKQDDSVQSVTYHIQVDQMTINAADKRARDPIVIPFKEEDVKEDAPIPPEELNPATGMPYTLMFEGVNNYIAEESNEEADNGVQDGLGSESLCAELEGDPRLGGLEDLRQGDDGGTDGKSGG